MLPLTALTLPKNYSKQHVLPLYNKYRSVSLLARPSTDSQSCVPLKITSKFHQKPLGSYPFPPEQEMLWKNRRKCFGGYYHQSISPYLLKFYYPVLHQFPARFWSKLSQGFWWAYWPALVTIFIIYTGRKENTRFIRRQTFD